MTNSITFAPLKYITVILLLAAMLAQTFNKCFILLDYQWNKAYIAKHLCVNRDKPGMKCAGKCYLCKRLKKEENKDQENPERKMGNGYELVSYWTAYQLTHPGSLIMTRVYPCLHESPLERSPRSFFHPPQVCVA